MFVLAYAIATNAANNKAGIKDNKKYFLPRGKIENYNILIGRKTFLINQVSTGQGDDSSRGWLLDYACFKNNYRLTAGNISKQKALDVDPRAI